MCVMVCQQIYDQENIVCPQSISMKILPIVNIDCKACNAHNPVTENLWR